MVFNALDDMPPEPDTKDRISKWVSYSAALRAYAIRQRDRAEAAEKELELERTRLVACGVIAMCDTPESAAKARRDIHPDYRSAALDDVIRRVDECMALRDKLNNAEKDAARYRWQPIETAPKDGRTLLLGHRNSLGNWRTMRGQWFSKGYIEENWECDDADEGWYETSVECEEDTSCWFTKPTHWMPLPAAPEAIDSAMGNAESNAQ